MLSIHNVSAGYGRDLVLRNVSLEVQRGEFLGLLGPNGCGKTTLLRVVSAVLRPREGRVLLDGMDVQKIERRSLARIMACLSQDLTLDFPFTVREVVLMGRAPHLPRIGRETSRDLQSAERAMAVADVLHLANCSITEISGGERQRAFIAMCLAQEPQVLLLDEPVSHLDIGHQLATLEMIRTLNRQDNVTVLAVFHDLNLAAEFCDRLAILNRGELEAIGPAVEVITSEMIRDVYGAQVYTEQNPVSHKPHIVVAAGMNGQRANVDHWAVSGPCPLPSVSRSGGGGEHGQP